MLTATHHRLIARSGHCLHFERLELRTLLSVSSGGIQEPFAQGELLIGFEGEVPEMLGTRGAERALDLALDVVGSAGLHSGRILYDLPARENQAARVATHWQLAATIDVQDVAMQLSQLPGIAYAEPNTIMTSQSIPGDASFVGDWPFGVQEHLPRIGAPEAWDITTGDPGVVVAVVDSGVDLNHPDLNDNVLAGTTFVVGTATSQDDNGHGTLVAGLIAAEMDNLTELASEADGDPAWAGGVVGVAPNVSILPVKVLNQDGNGLVSDIAAGISYAVDPDGDPATDDGADIINVSLGGGGVSQVVSDAIANAYRQGALVIASVTLMDWGGGHPALDPYTLAVTAVDADDVWDGDHATGSFVDISAQGVDVLTTFVDREDPSETIDFGGAYGRESGSSLSTPIVAGAAALIKSLHPEWGPNEVAGQLLATADSISSINALTLQGQLGAGRVSASAAVGPTARPRVISLVGLGDVEAEVPELVLVPGDRFEVRFSHAMQTTSVLDSARYQLLYLGDPATTSDDQTVELSVVTEPLPPGATGVTDADTYYVSFPGRGVQLQVGAFPGSASFPAGLYRLTVSGVSTLESGLVQTLSHEFRVASRANFSDPHLIVQPELDGPQVVFAVDLDGDQDLDLLTATQSDNRVVWYENTDGAGTFGPQREISTVALEGGRGIARAADLDGDGDMDVLHVIHEINTEDDKVVWYENVDGTGNFGPPQMITTLATRANVHAADLDGDGDVDVLSLDDDKIAWFENTDGSGTFGTPQVITTLAPRARANVHAADLDGDGDVDVLSSYRGDDTIVWFDNADGKGTFERYVITTTVESPRSTIAADVDGDGDLDVLASVYDGIALYENTDGAGSFGPQRSIGDNEEWVWHLRAADVDQDGDLDVLQAADDNISWYENLGADGTFGAKRVIFQTSSFPSALSGGAFIDAADVDTDGDLDVVFAATGGDMIAWHENIDGTGSFGLQHRIGSGVSSPDKASTSDLDGDGDLDVICGRSFGRSDEMFAWHENTDGLGTYGPQRVIAQAPDGAVSDTGFSTADLDGDGDLDLIARISFGEPRWVGTIVWYENTDGLGTFGPQRVITQDEHFFISSVSAADLDGDGDLDVLSGKIAWYENTDGAGSFGSQHLISQGANGVGFVSAADLDGDGDLDVLASEDEKMTWYENTDGLGTFGPQRVITQGWWSDISIADLDGDSDQDLIARGNAVAWFENEDGAGSFGPQRVISQGGSVAVADLDNDGDVDVISASRRDDGTTTVAFYENVDGAGTFGPQIVIAPDAYRQFKSVLASDVDTDGDLDVVYASERGIVWYENLLAHAGDANRDGLFNSSDLVQVFQAGQYEDDVEDNSSWEEGDWNGDGDFDSSDLVEAFKGGLYERKSLTVASKIAAAVDWLFAHEEDVRRARAFVA